MPNEQQGWYFDPGALDGLAKPTTRLLVINFQRYVREAQNIGV